MHLIDWTPEFSGKVYGGNTVSDTALRFKGTLRCPVCGKDEAVETEGHLLYGPVPVSLLQIIFWEFGSLVEKRTCESCGVVSAMPKTDRVRLLTEANETVTDDWVAQKIREYPSLVAV